jgi:hypothetical protein
MLSHAQCLSLGTNRLRVFSRAQTLKAIRNKGAASAAGVDCAGEIQR